MKLSIVFFCLVVLLLHCHAELQAESALHMAAKQGAGYIVYKEQDFYNASLADIVRFIGIIDRRAEDGSNRGNITCVLGEMKTIDVPARCIITILYDSDISPSELASDEQLAVYKGVRAKIVEAAKINSAANITLTPLLKGIDRNMSRYELGNRRIDGEWLTPERVIAERVSRDEASIRKQVAEIKEEMQSCYNIDACNALRGDIAWEGRKSYGDAATQAYLARVVNDLTRQLDTIQEGIRAKLREKTNAIQADLSRASNN